MLFPWLPAACWIPCPCGVSYRKSPKNPGDILEVPARKDGRMISLEKILLPTDFSEYSGAARDYACSLAEKFQAELHVLHVLQDLVAMAPEPGMSFPPPGDYMKELEASAKQALEKFPGDALPAG